jgi:hypothetical protein
MELRPRKAPGRKQSLSGSMHSPVLSYFQSSIANLMKILRTKKENNRKFAIDLLETGMGPVLATMVRNVLMHDINLNTFFETPMRPLRECFEKWARHKQMKMIRKNRGSFNEKESQLAFTTNRLGWDESFLPDSNSSFLGFKKVVAKKSPASGKRLKAGRWLFNGIGKVAPVHSRRVRTLASCLGGEGRNQCLLHWMVLGEDGHALIEHVVLVVLDE